MTEFPDRTKSRRLWASTAQELGLAGTAGKRERKKAFNGAHGLMS